MNDVSTPSARPGHVIGIGMQKGGVSKTTNACHIAVALGELGRRVLALGRRRELWRHQSARGATERLLHHKTRADG